MNKNEFQKEDIFSIGEENTAFAEYFIGKSYLNGLVAQPVPITNVTFEAGCRNNWHIHHGGGQILLCTAGCGYYQEWGKEAQELHPGDVVNIPPEVKHWHGATPDSWFSHIALSVTAENGSCEWLEPARKPMAAQSLPIRKRTKRPAYLALEPILCWPLSTRN